ncbi:MULTISPECIES: NADH:flavin oxidoreductase/NADH oxidase family protein [unclassified Pseudomonas]|uniref:NADH:flavin oxidoreductase/NADH oxidase family protein n=1 Tax=unclassified Pseudomonas TaxID=196821 RepID=UPI000876AA48|nr:MULTISPECIES: NADH:flavin oxidoreductase/NADH oxidase family protein [unclassified Pseudomonas]SCZ39936.1 NADH:flavin oxidoreductase / NADH oxidase family protein [Pseudomonas sp. NFACC44-2]SDA89804.1 NADH:flavin oxidoreductase / NADH oxidase family protein [Pseudomonas sp. NFACC51]SDW42840.1 NADH:flavin oxidoreductase / NADH oxidase family protein [Pseudomonas sp. NFACC08-1]SFI16378.1 NADH:flavin oxidoreductase / NADH oxidase family protein [Pseudomonas sp. NFACC54]SFT28394.1 NADH:flavin o
MSVLFSPMRLPNGVEIPNRIAKAAMEENLADPDHAPGEQLIRLYRTWAEGGAGLIITGNVMVDRNALTGPCGVVLESDRHLDRFRRWADACRSHGAQAWMQINHPGRQLMAALGQIAVAPSQVAVELPGLGKLFAKPRALDCVEIEALIQRYVRSAELAEQAGFTGVQIHAAHGYLFSQFLSPLSNRRSDHWGGSLENRARILLRTVEGVRTRVGASFCVSVKLNSADFQRGGFDSEDAAQVLAMLKDLGVDLVELSGGSYESPAMQGRARDGSSLAREAYFLEFAERIATKATMPLMVTGGIRRRGVAERVVAGRVAMVGMATALAIDPTLPRQWRQGGDQSVAPVTVSWKNKAYASAAIQAIVKKQLALLGSGRPADPKASPLLALLGSQLKTRRQSRAYRRWLARAD